MVEFDKLPRWVQRRLKLSQRALQELARKRGKDLRVFKGLDTKGI